MLYAIVEVAHFVHLQLVWTAKMAGKQVKLNYAVEEIVSYLPLSHVAAQILDIYIPMMYAGTVYFAQPDALKVGLAPAVIKWLTTVVLTVDLPL